MILKDKSGKEIVIITNFFKRYNTEPIFIEADVEVYFNDVYFKESIEIELIDVLNLKKYFEGVKEKSRKYFFFENIDKLFKVSFQVINSEIIVVEGFISNKRYTKKLDFSFEITLNMIDDLVLSLDSIIFKFNT
jgi:hypothetical protein